MEALEGTTVKTAAPPRQSLFRQLYFQVLVAMVAGVLLGWLWPELGAKMQPLANAFIKLIKAVVAPVIFVTVVSGIAKMGDLRKTGKVGVRALIYFEVVSTIALVMGFAVGNWVEPGKGMHIDPATLDISSLGGIVNTAGSGSLVDFFMGVIPRSLVGVFVDGEILPLLVVSILFGFALANLGKPGERIIGIVDDLTHALFAIVRIVMYLAVPAAFGAMAFTVGGFGAETLGNFLKVILAVFLSSVIFVIVIFGGISRLLGLRLWKIVRYFKEELLIAFGATSGEAMLPRAIAKLDKLGCSKDVVGLVLPTGFSFNMDGTAIYMSTGILFIAQAMDVPLSFADQAVILLIMLFTSKGAAGVTGGGFVALAATLPAVPAIPIAGLMLLVGIDRPMSQVRAVTNLFGNIFATVAVAKWVGQLDEVKSEIELEKGSVGDPLAETRNGE